MKIVWNRSIGFNLELYKARMSFNGMAKFSPSTFTPMEQTIITDGADCYPWTETFVIFPKKTISGRRICWEKAYKRRVWLVWGTGFHMEPETQYATLFDLIAEQHII